MTTESMPAYGVQLYNALGVDAFAAQLKAENCQWAETFSADMRHQLATLKHGDLPAWLASLDNAPQADQLQFSAHHAEVSINSHPPLNHADLAQLNHTLQTLKPWRKGPFNFFGTAVDTEWRSDLKWQRIAPHLELKNKNILDVGCANGYFGWRMLAAGAKSVLGIDPGWMFIIQFLLMKQYAGDAGKHHTVLPYKLEDLPNNLNYFDSVFSMGVLYHRRSVFDHLFELKACLKSGGELILETLVIESKHGQVLVPEDRYARMRNVWFIPSSEVLGQWLARAGFIDIQLIDETNTTLEEQRKTPWIDSQSLEYCLDTDDPTRTIEGYPAPRRATFLARKP
ncbi:MAG: tRNA 5-methoxyuridine(34)/uridine 5-oxyacetic acid(34) synthase CmoB [Arenicellales bacterium]